MLLCFFFICYLFLERPRCGLSFDLQLDSQKKGLHEHSGNNLFYTSIILVSYLPPVLLSAFIVSFKLGQIFALLCLEKSTTIHVNWTTLDLIESIKYDFPEPFLSRLTLEGIVVIKSVSFVRNKIKTYPRFNSCIHLYKARKGHTELLTDINYYEA